MMASHRVAPIPYAASFTRYGMRRKASCETAATVGSTMIARTSDAGARPGPLSVVLKNGIHPSFALNQSATGRIAGTTTKSPHSPEHDARDGGDHPDDDPKDLRQARREKVLGKEDRKGDAEDPADRQGEQRAVEGAPDVGENPELLAADIPGCRRQERQAVVA